MQAKDDDLHGEVAGARRKGRIALFLNIFAAVLTIVCYAIIIGVAFTLMNVESNRCYYNYNYNTTFCY